MGIGEKRMIWAILIVGFILRLISLNQSLWLDEAINVLAVKNNTFLQILIEYPKFDFHPPGYFLILWGWTRIFGFSEIAVRMPSVMFGLMTVWLSYLMGKKLASKEIGILSALLLAINPLHIYYSQEARMYSLAAFAVTLNFYYFLGVLASTPPRWALILSNLLVFLSDYLAYLIFPAQFISLILLKKTKLLKTWLVSLSLAAIFFILWIPIFLEQLHIGQVATLSIPAWKMVVGEGGIRPLILTYVKFTIGRISHPDNLIYGLLFLPVGMLFAFLGFQGAAMLNKLNKILLLSWIGIPIISAWLISFVVPIYSYFRLLFVLPAFVILVVQGASKFRFKYALIALVILIETISASIYLFNPVFQREDWRGLVNFLKSKKRDFKILFESNGSFAPFDYYASGSVRGIGALKNFPAKNENDLADLQGEVKGVNSIFLVDYLVDISDPERLVSKKLSQLGYELLETENFNGVGFVYIYTKR